MKRYFLIAITLTALVGCGEDVGSRRGSPTATTPGLGGEAFVSASQIHRNRGLNILSTQTLTTLVTGNALPAGYRIVPLMAVDDEGLNGKNIRTRTGLGRPVVDCGVTANSTLSGRISECNTLNPETASWLGSTFGASGEANWRLVAKSGIQEVWHDVRTGHLWSDVVANSNWCDAAGNNLEEAGAGVNCKDLGTNFSCVGKVIMGISGVSWRLPTRNDFLQGDLDGLRFVLKESGTSGFWTATLNSSSTNRSEAWVYKQKQGTLETDSLADAHDVRCIGSATTVSI